MNRSKVLEKFSNRFKTKRTMEQSDIPDRKMKKEQLRNARRQKREEEEDAFGFVK